MAALSERFDWPNEAEMRYTTVRAGGGTSGLLDCSFLRDALVPPASAHTPAESTAAHVQSVVHELDIALRRVVGQHMAQWSAQQQHEPSAVVEHKAAVSQYARDANELRRRVLSGAKQPGTALYEMMRAAEGVDEGVEDEQRQVQAAVLQTVSYFQSLIDSTASAGTLQSN